MRRVSVVMAAYNAAGHINATIESLLQQTYKEFELIIIDDGSTDDTARVVSAYQDPRIILIRSNRNRGIAVSRNLAATIASGEFIAVHDADDLSAPDRFAEQVAFLDMNPDIGVVGSCGWLANHNSRLELNVPLNDRDLQIQLLGRNMLHHSSLMIRKHLFDLVGGYDDFFAVAEDYDLVLRLAEVTKVANLKERLYIKSSRADSETWGGRSLLLKRMAVEAVDRAIIRRRERGLPAKPHCTFVYTLLGAAVAEAIAGNESETAGYIMRAMDTDQDLAHSDESARFLAHRIHTYSLHKADVKVETVVKRLFENWPIKQRARMRRLTRAMLLSADANVSFREQRWHEVPGLAARSLVTWPGQPGSRGLLSMGARAAFFATRSWLKESGNRV